MLNVAPLVPRCGWDRAQLTCQLEVRYSFRALGIGGLPIGPADLRRSLSPCELGLVPSMSRRRGTAAHHGPAECVRQGGGPDGPVLCVPAADQEELITMAALQAEIMARSKGLCERMDEVLQIGTTAST